MTEDEFNKLELTLSQAFSLPKTQDQDRSIETHLKQMKENIQYIIERLIETDLSKLLHILYRIDISQEDTDESFQKAIPTLISAHLADKIIQRQLLKLRSQQFYKNKNN